MALSRSDYMDLLRFVQSQLREVDPDAFEVVAKSYERSDTPRFTLINYLSALTRLMSERSGGSHGRILNRLNAVVRRVDGEPVQGLRVLLSPEEQELFQTESVNLASLPDRSEFVRIIDEVLGAILEEEELQGPDQ